MSLTITGSAGEFRPLDILIWYPAESSSYEHSPASTYAPRLKGVSLPAPYDALSWKFTAERARGNPAIKSNSHSPYPVIVVSHPAVGDPYSYSKMSERLASHGFIVVAPTHTGDTQDDTRVDFLATRGAVIACIDGLPRPCTDGLNKSMLDRARDVKAAMDNISLFFGDNVDMSRIGFIGTSRGAVTGLIVAGGSATLGIAADPRVLGLMLLSAGGNADPLPNKALVTIPTLQVTGTHDRNQNQARSTIDAISSTSKAYVVITNAWHRGLTADSYCEQMQAIGPISQSNPNAILELHSLQNLLLSPASGTTLDFCPFEFFVEPVDIRPIVFAQTGVQVTPDNVPAAAAMALVSEMAVDLAVSFFDDVLDVRGKDRFGEYFLGKFQERYGENLTAVELQGFR